MLQAQQARRATKDRLGRKAILAKRAMTVPPARTAFRGLRDQKVLLDLLGSTEQPVQPDTMEPTDQSDLRGQPELMGRKA